MQNCWEDVPHGSQDWYPHYNLFQSSIFYDTDNFRVKYEDCLPSESSENEERSAEPPDKPPEAPPAREKRVVRKDELYLNPAKFRSKTHDGSSSSNTEPPSMPESQPWGYDWTKQSWVKELAPMVVIRDENNLPWPRFCDTQDKPNFSNSKGETMMQKMGWRGGSLGKSGNGVLRCISPEPVYAFRPSVGFGQRTRTAPRFPPCDPSPPPTFPLDQSATPHPCAPPPLAPAAAPPPATTPTPAHPHAAPKTPSKSEGGNPTSAGVKAVKKHGPKRDVFRTNVLLQILDFVQDDTETELLFDPSLRQYERRHIVNIVNTVVNDQAVHTLGSVAQYDIARDIHQCNGYVLDACRDGQTRQLSIYKEAPDDVYLVTPEDFLPKNEDSEASDDDAMEMEDENPFLKSIKKSIKKDDPVDEPKDEVKDKNEPKSITNKFETDCSIAKGRGGEETAADKMLEFFLEFAEGEAYKEMRFLGAFTDEQMEAINALLSDVALRAPGRGGLAAVLRRGAAFQLREGANGTTEVHKISSARPAEN